MPIKYLGSKRRLIGPIMSVVRASGASTAMDAFTGTTRVAQAMKAEGLLVTASDCATYSKAFADCYVATDARDVDRGEVEDAIARLMSLPGRRGYFTRTFCEESRFVQPRNGMRIDAMRDAIEDGWAGTPLHPILLTSLIEAADRVDSTTGLQMAYLKRWSRRSHNDIELRVPALLDGPGRAILGDVFDAVASVGHQGLIYLDPPYNQHRYFANYHVWETLTRWDAPGHYGVACKRLDARDGSTRSVFNSRRDAPGALARLFAECRPRCDALVVSYNDESWVGRREMGDMLRAAGFGDAMCLSFDLGRYVGARIGIHDPQGRRVGEVGRVRNSEWLFVAGTGGEVSRMRAALAAEGLVDVGC